MRILITGSTGHVGGAIARHLGYAGHEVAGLSRHAAPTDSCDEHHAIDLAEPMAAEQVLDTVKGCDAIVHAAADLSKDLLSPTVPVTNGLGTVHMLRVARTWEVRAFVFISGVNVVGTPHEVPIREDHLPVPETSYHASKLYGEHLTRMAARAGTPASVLRLTAPVGPHMPSNRILPVFVTQALA